jgi:predicted site-specific integrase-resolvase
MANAIVSAVGPSVHSAHGSYLTTRQAGRLVNVSYQTIRRLMRDGFVEGVTLDSGHRRVSVASLRAYFGLPVPESEMVEPVEKGRVCLAVTRVSTQRQKAAGSLQRQRELVATYCRENFPHLPLREISSVRSGLSDTAPDFLRIIELIAAHLVAVLVVPAKDRLCRFGTGLIIKLCEVTGTKFIDAGIWDDDEQCTTAEQEMSRDILAICSVYANRQMGKRGADVNRLVLPQPFKDRVAVLWGSGLSKRAIIDQIEKEKWHDENKNRLLGEWAVRSVIKGIRRGNPENAKQAVPQSVKQFLAQKCTVGPSKRATTDELWQAFCAHCPAESKTMHRRKFFDTLKVAVRGLRFEKHGIRHRVWGLTLKTGT